jgi:hypothetical protein
MNSIQAMTRADFYMDNTRGARYFFADYDKAFNDAIENYIVKTLGTEKQRDPENFQWNQAIRDSLYTLLKNASPSITNGTVITNRYYSATPSHINYPTDYRSFVSLNVLIDSYTDYSRPTTYNEIGPLLKDSFRHPTNKKTYYNEDATGHTIWRGVGGTFTSATLEYIKIPNTFTVGNESQLISPGGAVLVNGLSYIALEISVQNASTYQIGDQFTAIGTALTSGIVILASNTVAIDLPSPVHEEICKMAAEIMLLATANYQASQAVESQVSKN